jgi:hypothetical protein
MKLSQIFLEAISEEVPVGYVAITAETESDGKREINKKFRFEYNTKDGKENITGKIEILRKGTRDEEIQLDADDNFESSYDDEFNDAEETVRENMDKIHNLKDEQTARYKVK